MDDLGLEKVAQQYGIQLLLQFGSTVSGHAHRQSDVDLELERDFVTRAVNSPRSS